MKPKGVIKRIKGLALTVALFISASAFAAGPPQPSELDNSLAIVLLVIAGSLLLIIGLLSYVLIGAGRFYVERLKEKQSTTVKAMMTIGIMVLSISAFAADPAATDATATAVATTVGGLSTFSFFMFISVIALELVVVLVMLWQLQQLLAKEKVAVVAEVEEAKEPLWKTWWAKMNSFRPVHEEHDIILDHDYDGIRELDNKLPPWWLYGFYICIIFGGIYLYRYHVTHSAPSTIEEYQIAMNKADEEKEAYLKSAANKVDENTVTLVTDASALAEGKKIFTGTCAACHGADGQGVVGPNLTDDYWLHKGGIKDIFKSIKYGVPEKGMKSWKDDFSPVQIAALASYIKSINGTKPANAKEPQGELFKDESTASDKKAVDRKLAVN